MSVLSVIQPSPDEPMMRPRGAASDLDAVKSTGWLDSMTASARTGVDEVPFVQTERLSKAYLPVIAAMADATGKGRFFAYVDPWKAANPLTRDKTDYDALWADIDRLHRQGKLPPGVPIDRGVFEGGTLNRDGARQRDQIVAAQGSTSARLVGGVLSGFADPYQVGLGLATGGASRGLSVGRAALVEGLVNMGMVSVEMPAIVAARARLGQDSSVEDVAGELGTAFAFGGVMGAGAHAVGAVWHGAKAAAGAVETRSPREVAKAFARAVPEHLRTPDQAAALAVIERDAQLGEHNPFEPGTAGEDMHHTRVDAAQRAIIDERPAPARPARPAAPAAPIETYLAAVKRSESGGNPNARNPQQGQTASGFYGFTDSTWLGAYRAEFPNSGLDNAGILSRKSDPALQERLMRRLTEDNARRLKAMGVEADPANLYIMHHLGTGDGPRVLRAAPDTPLSTLLSENVISHNRYMRDMTVGDFVAWSRERMGQERGAIDAPVAGASDNAMALEAERAQIEAERAAAERGAAASAAPGDPTPAIDAMAAPEPARVDPGMVDRERLASLTDDVPMLRRDLFPDDTTWRIEQAKVEAETLGGEPRMTRQSVWDDAVSELRAVQGGEVYGALYHPETGPIDVKWGHEGTGKSDGMGLAKIVRFHPEVLSNLPDELASMTVKSRSANRIRLESPSHQVSVRLDWDGNAQRWLMTAYERKGRKAPPVAVDERATGAARDGSPSARADRDISPASEQGNGPSGIEPAADALAARFADPASAEAKAQADSFTHDVAAAEQAGAFADASFATDNGEVLTPAQALARLDDDDAALAALRGCL